MAWLVVLAMGGVGSAPAWAAPTTAPLMDISRLETALPSSINPPADPAAANADFARFVQRTVLEMNPSDRATELPSGSKDSSFPAPYVAPESSHRIARQVFYPTRAPEMTDRPMAPLPPAVVAGPIGIALAGFIAWRANRRGGRI